MNVKHSVFHHHADERIGEALRHAPTEELGVWSYALVVTFCHHTALVQHHEGKGMAVIGTLADEGLSDRGEACCDGGVALRQWVLRFIKHSHREALCSELIGSGAAQQGYAVALAVGGGRFAPKEAAGDSLVIIVHLVAGVADEGEVQVECFDVFCLATRNEHRRSKILGSIARYDGQQSI